MNFRDRINSEIQEAISLKKTGKTFFDAEEDFANLINKSGVQMTGDRQRMALHEKVLFALIAAPSVQHLEHLQEQVRNLSNAELTALFHDEGDLVYIGTTDCYFMSEEQEGEKLYIGGFTGDYVGFFSIRKNRTSAAYHLGDTSTVFGEPAFQTDENHGGVLITKDSTTNDVLCGRLFIHADRLDVQSIIISKGISESKPDIDLKLTGKQRVKRSHIQSRGIGPGDNFSKPHEAREIDFIQSTDPEHHYDITGYIVGC